MGLQKTDGDMKAEYSCEMLPIKMGHTHILSPFQIHNILSFLPQVFASTTKIPSLSNGERSQFMDCLLRLGFVSPNIHTCTHTSYQISSTLAFHAQVLLLHASAFHTFFLKQSLTISYHVLMDLLTTCLG